MTAPIDLNAAWDRLVAETLESDRDPLVLSGSDLHACDYATYLRVHGGDQLPHDEGSFANFFRGRIMEDALAGCIGNEACQSGHLVGRSQEVSLAGIVGHLDFTLRDGEDRALAVIDPTTTAAKESAWKYGHALKSAFYALAAGAPRFCEWVFVIGFGGKIVKHEPHWFELDGVAIDDELEDRTWRELVVEAMDRVRAMVDEDEPPAMEPPVDPLDGMLETWRCGKVSKAGVSTSYCRAATCPRNARVSHPAPVGEVVA